MEKIKLTYVGVDDWDRILYKDKTGNYYKIVDGIPHISCPKKDPEGEPDYPIHNYEIVAAPTEREMLEMQHKFDYSMLSMHQDNLTAYLGVDKDGCPKEHPEGDCRYKTKEFVGEPKELIGFMRKYLANIPDEIKPEWCTKEQIDKYEKLLNHE